MLEEYYNKEIETLTLPINYNSLLEDLPLGTKIIIFKDNKDNEKNRFSEFNQAVDNLPSSLTHLIFGYYFNKKVDNLPSKINTFNIWILL